MSKHTPGPWHIGMKPGPMIYGPQGEGIADMSFPMLPKAEHGANTCLIVVAPELLAAAKTLVRRIERDNLHTTHGIKLQPLRNAIARAEGLK